MLAPLHAMLVGRLVLAGLVAPLRPPRADGPPPPPPVPVTRNGGDSGGSMLRGPDGRSRSRHLLPDFESENSAWAAGCVPQAIPRLSPTEGATAEVYPVLRKKPPKPIVGELAPPFAATTTSGPLRTLPDSRGKLLLIHLRSPVHRWGADLARVAALGRRAAAERLAVLGPGITAAVPAATRAIAGAWVAWPQAILRDRGADPLVLDRDAMEPPGSILIGPDGTVPARDLGGAQVDGAVDRFLGVNKE